MQPRNISLDADQPVSGPYQQGNPSAARATNKPRTLTGDSLTKEECRARRRLPDKLTSCPPHKGRDPHRERSHCSPVGRRAAQ